MLKPANTNVVLTNKGSLHSELEVWIQREKDMEIASSAGATGIVEKLELIRQEQAKLRKALRARKGFTRQRAWSQGKLLD